MPFIQTFTMGGMRDLWIARKIKAAILAERDSMKGSVYHGKAIYLPQEKRDQDAILGVSELDPKKKMLTRAPEFTPAQWDTTGGRVLREKPGYGLFLAPMKWGYRDEPFILNCLAVQFKYQLVAGWLRDAKVIDSHLF